MEKIIRELSDIVEPIIHKCITPHVFRHTTATTAIRNGVSVEDIQKLLGHENIATTMVYILNLRLKACKQTIASMWYNKYYKEVALWSGRH